MKNAVALLITLFFIMMLTILIGYNQEITQKSFDNIEAKKAAIQANITLHDVISIVRKKTESIKDSEGLSQLLSTPEIAFTDPESDIGITFSLQHAANKINLNKLLDYNQTSKRYAINQDYYTMLDRFLLQKNVLDSTFFLTLLLDTIDTDSVERNYESEIINQQPFFKQGGIYSWRHFEQILAYYREKRSDEFIDEIAWDNLVRFEGENLDYHYLSDQLLGMMMQRQFVRSADQNGTYKNYADLNDTALFSEDELKTLEKFDINFYEPTVSCNFGFNQFGYNYTINFLYDIKSKEAYRFAIQD